MKLEIRKMKDEDWPEVSRIYTQGIDEGRSTFTTECPEWESWNASHLPDCRFTALADGEIAGWAVIMPTSPRPQYSGAVEISIYIDKKCRGKGIGSALISALIPESEACGYWSLLVKIFAENSASIALFTKCGFRMIGRRERVARDRFGEWQDTVLMERRSPVI